VSELEKLDQQIAVLRELAAQLETQAIVIRMRVPPPQEKDPDWFEQAFGGCPLCGNQLRLVPYGRSGPFIGCKGYPACRYCRSLKPEERATREQARLEHHESHLAVDHRSTSAANAFDTKEAILEAMSRTTYMTNKTQLWKEIAGRKGVGGYDMFKAMLEELAAEGKIGLVKLSGGRWDISRTPNPASTVEAPSIAAAPANSIADCMEEEVY
jgi:ssDNA-binding Zn-finger/Zn-ribbon topoisomerase 1